MGDVAVSDRCHDKHRMGKVTRSGRMEVSLPGAGSSAGKGISRGEREGGGGELLRREGEDGDAGDWAGQKGPMSGRESGT